MKLTSTDMDPDPVLRETRDPEELDFKVERKHPDAEQLIDYVSHLEQLDVHSAQSVVGRAILDPAYREQLVDDPERALEGYEITSEEREALLSIDMAELDRIAEDFVNRFSTSEDDPDHPKMEGEVLFQALREVSTNVLKMDDVDMDIGGATHKDSWKGEA